MRCALFGDCACARVGYAYCIYLCIMHSHLTDHVYREYINNHVVDFARENPQCAVYVRFRPGRAPRLVGEYCKYKYS